MGSICGELGFDGAEPAATGRPAYHPAVLLKIYIYGYLNRIQSSRRLEREAQRNVELMWLTGRLMPDFKTIADFRKDNGRAIRKVCRQFIVLCRRLDLFTEAIVAIDGSKFKAVNNRDKNFTPAKMQRRMAQIEESIARYLAALDTADRAEPEVAELKKGARLQGQDRGAEGADAAAQELEAQMLASPDQQLSLTDPDARSMKSRDGRHRRLQRADRGRCQAPPDRGARGHHRGRRSRPADADGRTGARGHGHRRADRGGRPRLLQGRADPRSATRPGSRRIVPKSLTSNSQADGRFDKQDFIYIASDDEYRCPAGQRAIKRFTTVEHGMTLDKYWTSACPQVPAQGAMHDRRLSAHHALGARGGARGDAAAAGSAARDDASATTDGRAPVRHDQALDGLDPLPDQDAGARAHRDEPARPGLQPEASDQSARS